MHDVKVLFLIPEIKILSILRAAGEKLQGDIKAMPLSGECINTCITFDFNGSSEVTSNTMTVIYGEVLALNLMPTW
jgi:hypothetical protein